MASRIQPVVAWRALQALIRDPDDTEQAFRVIGALSGRSAQRLVRRFARSPRGSRLLRQRPDLVPALRDREHLASLPEDSLGRAYAEFTAREQLTAAGLIDASEAALAGGEAVASDEAERWVLTRLRDQHDLTHVVTGYGRDVRGELAVLAFTAAQTRNPGIAFIPLYLLRRAGLRSELGRLIRQGFRRGLRARWLVDQEWERLLGEPLAKVREELRLADVPRYEALRSAAAPPLA